MIRIKEEILNLNNPDRYKKIEEKNICYLPDIIYGDKMTTSQVIFRLDRNILKRLDGEIKSKGYRNRNEWFHSIVRRTIQSDEEFLKHMAEIAREKGITDEEVMKACREVRHEVYREVYGDD